MFTAESYQPMPYHTLSIKRLKHKDELPKTALPYVLNVIGLDSWWLRRFWLFHAAFDSGLQVGNANDESLWTFSLTFVMWGTMKEGLCDRAVGDVHKNTYSRCKVWSKVLRELAVIASRAPRECACFHQRSLKWNSQAMCAQCHKRIFVLCRHSRLV